MEKPIVFKEEGNREMEMIGNTSRGSALGRWVGKGVQSCNEGEGWWNQAEDERSHRMENDAGRSAVPVQQPKGLRPTGQVGRSGLVSIGLSSSIIIKRGCCRWQGGKSVVCLGSVEGWLLPF